MKNLSFWLLLIIACKETKPVSTAQPSISACEAKIDVALWRKEILSVDSMQIGSRLNYKNNIEDVVDFFGKPELMASVPGSFGYMGITNYGPGPTNSLIWYGSTAFEKYGEQCAVHSIDFESTDVEVSFPELVFYKGMNVSEICDVFPESCKLVLAAGNLWSGHIELRASNRGLDPRRVFLIFQNQRLRKIVIYSFGG